MNDINKELDDGCQLLNQRIISIGDSIENIIEECERMLVKLHQTYRSSNWLATNPESHIRLFLCTLIKAVGQQVNDQQIIGIATARPVLSRLVDIIPDVYEQIIDRTTENAYSVTVDQCVAVFTRTVLLLGADIYTIKDILTKFYLFLEDNRLPTNEICWRYIGEMLIKNAMATTSFTDDNEFEIITIPEHLKIFLASMQNSYDMETIVHGICTFIVSYFETLDEKSDAYWRTAWISLQFVQAYYLNMNGSIIEDHDSDEDSFMRELVISDSPKWALTCRKAFKLLYTLQKHTDQWSEEISFSCLFESTDKRPFFCAVMSKAISLLDHDDENIRNIALETLYTLLSQIINVVDIDEENVDYSLFDKILPLFVAKLPFYFDKLEDRKIRCQIFVCIADMAFLSTNIAGARLLLEQISRIYDKVKAFERADRGIIVSAITTIAGTCPEKLDGSYDFVVNDLIADLLRLDDDQIRNMVGSQLMHNILCSKSVSFDEQHKSDVLELLNMFIDIHWSREEDSNSDDDISSDDDMLGMEMDFTDAAEGYKYALERILRRNYHIGINDYCCIAPILISALAESDMLKQLFISEEETDTFVFDTLFPYLLEQTFFTEEEDVSASVLDALADLIWHYVAKSPAKIERFEIEFLDQLLYNLVAEAVDEFYSCGILYARLIMLYTDKTAQHINSHNMGVSLLTSCERSSECKSACWLLLEWLAIHGSTSQMAARVWIGMKTDMDEEDYFHKRLRMLMSIVHEQV
jgi:hypothetical protein